MHGNARMANLVHAIVHINDQLVSRPDLDDGPRELT